MDDGLQAKLFASKAHQFDPLCGGEGLHWLHVTISEPCWSAVCQRGAREGSFFWSAARETAFAATTASSSATIWVWSSGSGRARLVWGNS